MSGGLFSTWYRAKYFLPREFACKCNCGLGEDDAMPSVLLVALDVLRAKVGVPLRVNSGWRCEWHNRRVGGVENSKHIIGCAADIASGVEMFPAFREVAAQFGLRIIEYGAKNFVHIEIPERK